MRTKVLVVDDSVFMRVVLTRLLVAEPSLEVVGTAKDGKEAIEKITALKPDVVTLDVEMPVMNGLHALKQIMAVHPTPVIMLSALTADGAQTTLECLKYGAFDFMAKPEGSWGFQEMSQELIAKVKAAAATPISKLKVSPETCRSDDGKRLTDATATRCSRRPTANSSENPSTCAVKQIVAIGTSTGGPPALDVVLSRLPGDLPCPLVIVQHMPPPFTQSLAQRLNSRSEVKVVEAFDGLLLQNGVAYIAPAGYHMEVVSCNGNYRICLNQGDKRNQHRPSVDVLFESVAKMGGVERHFVLMTGMGHDGAQGMRLAKDLGARTTMVQSPESCVVSGMPKAALELDCVTDIVALTDISERLAQVIYSLI